MPELWKGAAVKRGWWYRLVTSLWAPPMPAPDYKAKIGVHPIRGSIGRADFERMARQDDAGLAVLGPDGEGAALLSCSQCHGDHLRVQCLIKSGMMVVTCPHDNNLCAIVRIAE